MFDQLGELDPLTTEETPVVPSAEDIEREVRAFEEAERKRLGLDRAPRHWRDDNPQTFTRAQREHTTILFGGLTIAQDYLIQGALSGIGYRIQALDLPDNESLRYGKEYGNRGQCNPTYFTVGNLIKYLTRLRDEHGLSTEAIVRDYLFLTAGACGPCRFGTYTTEYRKALRDAGFDGFRVVLFQQQGGLKQATGEGVGLEMNPRFFLQIIKAIMTGDILNAMGYRLRPYEVIPGSTDAALRRCKDLCYDALHHRRNMVLTLRKCRKILDQVQIDRLTPKPKVTIIGEFWAMTTEGDGNYRLQKFLEDEGAEVDIQLVTAWLLYNIWEVRHDTQKRMMLRGEDSASKGLAGIDAVKRLRILDLAEKALTTWFSLYCRAIGLEGYQLPNMLEIATISHQYYHNELRGGEGHMEVGKLIQSVEKKKAHMVVSVKPFGCMPSSSVSDGVQSLVTARFPEAIFCAIETTGDAAVNTYSRVQMMLFKARQAAGKELADRLDEHGLSLEAARERIAKSRRLRRPTHYPRHVCAGTAANAYLEAIAAR